MLDGRLVEALKEQVFVFFCGLSTSLSKTRDFIYLLYHRSSKITVFVQFTVSLPCLMESVYSKGEMLGAERRGTTKRRRQSSFLPFIHGGFKPVLH